MRLLSTLLGLVPLLGLAELGLHQYFAQRAPDFEDYRALAPELLKSKRPGVPVVVSPRWAEPMLRQAAGAAFPIAELARPDDSGFARFLEVSLLGETSPELASFPVLERRRVGAFQLLLHENPHAEPPLFDFANAVDAGEVQVYREVERQRSPCAVVERARGASGGLHGPVARPARHHECSGGRVVAVTLIEDQDYRPRRCILVAGGKVGRIVLTFSSVPSGGRLVGWAGFSYFLGRDSARDAVRLDLTEGARPLGQFQAQGKRGWQRFELSRPLPGGTVEVAVERVAEEPSDFCFALEAR